MLIYVKEGEIIDDYQYACVYANSEDTKHFFSDKIPAMEALKGSHVAIAVLPLPLW